MKDRVADDNLQQRLDNEPSRQPRRDQRVRERRILYGRGMPWTVAVNQDKQYLQSDTYND